jgi:GntR family histidine utilization transcriptional repressor
MDEWDLRLDGNGPIGEQIRRAVARAIMSGGWPPGTRIPSEEQLTEAFRCSRMTVNRALSELAKERLIVRRRKRGSFVATPSSEQSVLEIRNISAEIQGLGQTYRYQLLHRRQRGVTRAEAACLSLKPRDAVVDVACCHSADGVPMQLEYRLISLAAVPEAAEEPFATEPPGAWLLRRIPWSEAEHEIMAEPASAAEAQRLEIAVGSACLIINRRTWRNGEIVTAVRLVHPGHRRKLVARFMPDAPAR